jgi:hypothetical protein
MRRHVTATPGQELLVLGFLARFVHGLRILGGHDMLSMSGTAAPSHIAVKTANAMIHQAESVLLSAHRQANAPPRPLTIIPTASTSSQLTFT